ncbi:MAG: hypothetical protein GY903_20550 [Fuerstiella sp.]|nr:hypothetical protein [Fuerstiella sp.]MCP4856879.1 hypothetical protein [Fuerstiella sp.]
MNRPFAFRCFVILCVTIASCSSLTNALSGACAADSISLTNEHIRVVLTRSDNVWKMTRIARADGSESLLLDNDEFEILLFDDSRFTIADYEAAGTPTRSQTVDRQTVEVTYDRRAGTNERAPERVQVTYTLGPNPWMHKAVRLNLNDGDRIDRLAVQRFSTDAKIELGGRGQPLNIENWWFGGDYPCFYSRHTDGFRNPDFYYRWDYMIDLEGRDRILEPREHLGTIFHYPGFARKQEDGSWGILSKDAVFGISATKGDNAELGLLDYVNAARKPTRSYLHFNNWYSNEARKLTKESFIEKTYRPMVRQLRKHGANLDGMVPDHGWETIGTRIYEPQLNATHEPLSVLRKILKEDGSGLGIWIALDGTNQRFDEGLRIGYESAYGDDFDRSQFRWMGGNKLYYNILQPRYFNDVKKALRFLIAEVGVDYIKHDFNHNFTSRHLSQRHAREACLDATLELLAYERELNPEIFINYTNGAWFSPFWLQHVDCLWMMTGDSGGSSDWPHISLRDGATTYRCKYFFQSFNNPERCPRPTIPIANFMTHGILLSHRKPFTDFEDTLRDWSDYVVMYMARGTTLKELYLDLDLLDDDHWKVLATTSRWAELNQDRLLNTVYVGGDPAKGQAYGYISWVDGKAILTVRNPDRRAQVIDVPFDERVFFRGEKHTSYRARVIYPFVEKMPWRLTSGKDITIEAAGDTVTIYELDPGVPTASMALTPDPLPAATATVEDQSFRFGIQVPDEEFLRYDLYLQSSTTADTVITINGVPVTKHRVNTGGRWTAGLYDLRKFRGRTLTIEGQLIGLPSDEPEGREVKADAWIIADRRVDAPKHDGAVHDKADLPFLISQQHRRITQQILNAANISVAANSDLTPLAQKLARARKK